MGMGKTMQTLVYLGSMMRAQSIHNALIVCPKSVVRNWEREANLMFKDIVPKCKVCAITSDMGKEKRIREFTEAFCRWVFDVLPCTSSSWQRFTLTSLKYAALLSNPVWSSQPTASLAVTLLNWITLQTTSLSGNGAMSSWMKVTALKIHRPTFRNMYAHSVATRRQGVYF